MKHGGLESGQNPLASWALTHIFILLKIELFDLILDWHVGLGVVYYTAVSDILSIVWLLSNLQGASLAAC
jgi:hypothetical protein